MKLSIVGVGKVGATLAFAVVMQGLVDELVLMDQNAERAEGEASDLRHGMSFLRHTTRVVGGGLDATADSDVLVLTLSKPWTPGEIDRTKLATENTRLFANVVPDLAALSPRAKLIIVSNPVDALTHHVITLSGFPPDRVMGTGTLIDSARFRSILADNLRIHPSDLRAYIFGEHGSTQFPALSLARAAGVQIDPELGKRAFEEATEGAYTTFRAKGHTSFASALTTSLVIESIAQDSCLTMPLSTHIDGYLGVNDVCLSVPVVVGREGIIRKLLPELSQDEVTMFRRSAEKVRSLIEATRGELA
jgi:L-lactate dehydrogenase